MKRKNVHVVGTGTIGEPLIGLLCDYRDQLGIDNVSFHKNTPLLTDRSKVIDIVHRGARLAVDEKMMSEIAAIKLAINPNEVLFVVDSMTGQDAVNTAKAFND